MQYAIELYYDEETEKELLALAQKVADEVFYKASDLILHEFEKIAGEFKAIGLTKVTFPVEEICTIDLCR